MAEPMDNPYAKVDLSNKKLRRIPKAVLVNAELVLSLDLSSNRKINLSKDLEELVNVTRLTLRHCGLLELPKGLDCLQKLEELDISWNDKLTRLPHFICMLPGLNKLNVSQCCLTQLPDDWNSLMSLVELNIDGNENLSTLPPSICHLRALKQLHANGCDLTELPPDGWKDMKSLKSLYISGNEKLTALPSSICQLPELKQLHAASCGLIELPDGWKGMTSLEVLNISGNKELTTLPPSICLLHALKKLDVSGCCLRILPDGWEGMKELEVLDISENNLRTLPTSMRQLHALKILEADRNRLNNLPDGLEGMKSLQVLRLNDNCLNTYPTGTLGLKSLQYLDLSNDWHGRAFAGRGNNISELPEEVIHTSLTRLRLDGNPMVYPPAAVCDQGIEAIRQYFRDITQDKVWLRCDTINMLGDTGAGKTSIVQSLLIGRPSTAAADDRTRVIDQSLVNIENQIINVNDFGGHEIYQTVVPIFLPSNGLCIIAFDISLKNVGDLKEQVKKWLMTIFAKSTEIRVIVVGTHSDCLEPGPLENVEEEMKEYVNQIHSSAVKELGDHIKVLESSSDSSKTNVDFLKRHLENIKAADIKFTTMSCKDNGKSLSEFESLVKNKLKAPEPYPALWFRIMKGIKGLKSEDDNYRPYLEWKQVKQLYEQLDLEPDESTLNTILRILVSTSQIIWLEDSSSLKDFVFNQPRQIVLDLKKVLHHESSESLQLDDYYKDLMDSYREGLLDRNFFAQLLGSSYVDVVSNFMQHFHMITTSKDEYILTGNLLEQPPSTLQEWLNKAAKDPPVCLQLSFLGNYMPLAFFPTNLASVLSWLRSKNAEPTYWKDGVLVKLDYVRIIMRRNKSALELVAFSKSGKQEVWTALHSLLDCIYDNLAMSWKGVPPICKLVCPESRYVERPTDQQPHGRPVAWNKLANDGKSRAEPRHSRTWHCDKCHCKIPAMWMYLQQPGSCSIEEQEKIDEYLERFRNDGKAAALLPCASSDLPASLAAPKKRSWEGNLVSDFEKLPVDVCVSSAEAQGASARQPMLTNEQTLKLIKLQEQTGSFSYYVLNDDEIHLHAEDEKARQGVDSLKASFLELLGVNSDKMKVSVHDSSFNGYFSANRIGAKMEVNRKVQTVGMYLNHNNVLHWVTSAHNLILQNDQPVERSSPGAFEHGKTEVLFRLSAEQQTPASLVYYTFATKDALDLQGRHLLHSVDIALGPVLTFPSLINSGKLQYTRTIQEGHDPYQCRDCGRVADECDRNVHSIDDCRFRIVRFHDMGERLVGCHNFVDRQTSRYFKKELTDGEGYLVFCRPCERKVLAGRVVSSENRVTIHDHQSVQYDMLNVLLIKPENTDEGPRAGDSGSVWVIHGTNEALAITIGQGCLQDNRSCAVWVASLLKPSLEAFCCDHASQFADDRFFEPNIIPATS